jgi:predicted MFS family arabinose efflux permease
MTLRAGERVSVPPGTDVTAESATRETTVAAWLVWSLVALAYVLVFLQRVAPPTILDRLMADLQVGATRIGWVISAYFYGYMLMQIPAGLLVDRWPIRRIVLGSLALSTVGTWWFAHAGSLAEAVGSRALVAVADAVIFTSLIKVVTQWFPARRFGVMSGISQTGGYVGGLLATAPLALLVADLGWRASFEVLAGVIAANYLIALVVLRNHPSTRDAVSSVTREPAWRAVRGALSSRAWGVLLTRLGTYVAFTSFSGSWGVPLFMQAYGLPRQEASAMLFSFMGGYAVGCVVFGYLADSWFRSIRRPLIAMAIAQTALLLVLTPLIGPRLSWPLITGAVAILGCLGGGTNPLVLTCLRLTFGGAGLATALGVMMTIANLASALVQPLLGAILDATWPGAYVDGARLYGPDGYAWLLLALAAISVCSIVGPLFVADKPQAAGMRDD